MSNKPDFDHMMSSSIFLLYCLLTFSLYSISQHTSYSYSLDFTPARKLSMSSPGHDHKYHETQVADERMEGAPANADFTTLEDERMEGAPDNADFTTLEITSNSYSPHDLIYHTDYHGVTTHPTPKHPKP